MSSLLFKILGAFLAAFVTVAFAASACAEDAKPRKHKKTAAVSTTSRSVPQHWGTDKVPAGPLYFNGGLYLGDDPDPNIRFQLNRDISGRLGGEGS